MANFTVTVVRNGKRIERARVRIWGSGAFQGYLDEDTNSQGQANFSTSMSSGKIYVNGNLQQTDCRFKGDLTVHIWFFSTQFIRPGFQPGFFFLLRIIREHLDFSWLKATLTAMTIVSSHNTDRETASSWDAKDREARSRETVSQHQTTNSQHDETFFDANMSSLRPTLLDEYIGQESLKRQIKRAIASARAREASLEHILLYGPPWLGKTTLAAIIAREMSVPVVLSSGASIDKPSDLVSLLTGLQPGSILFIDEIHRLKPHLEEILYIALEDYRVDILVGTGVGAKSVSISLPPFTLIGATTKLSKIAAPLRDRFGNIYKLEYYTHDELGIIARRTFGLFGYEYEWAHILIESISARSRGTPRITNRLVKYIRDHLILSNWEIDTPTLHILFDELGIDQYGLTPLDRSYLQTLMPDPGKSPKHKWLTTLAAFLSEEIDTVEHVVEPYLLQRGYIERTPRGRIITARWIEIIDR